jgi:hypothetical protein
MKFKTLVAIAISGLLATSFANAKAVYQTVDDDQSMQAPSSTDNGSNNMGAMPMPQSGAGASVDNPSAADTTANPDDATSTDTGTGDQATGDDDY